MAVTAQLKSFTPHPGVNVSAESVFKGRVTVTWDVQSGGGTATHFIIGAIDATTGARHENIAREEGGDAIGSIVVNPAELTVGRKLHFFVTAIVESAHGVTLFSSAPSEPSKSITIQPKDFSAVPLNAIAVWKSDCSALAKLIATPRDATHGKWSSAQHSGAMRSNFVRGLGLVRVPRLGKAINARAPTLLAAISQVANTANAMRDVLRYAVPQYCTPTDEEQREICTICHRSDEPALLEPWIKNGIDPNMVGPTPRRSVPLLVLAAREGHVGQIDLLLQSGVDVDQKQNHTGLTPLFIAAQNDHVTVVTKLIAAGADVNKCGRLGATPLYAAAQKDHVLVVRQLIEAGADVNKARTNNGCTPLIIATVKKNHTVLQQLIAAGADVNKARTTQYETTALYIAAQNADLAAVTMLIAAGADVNMAETGHGMTPLYYAANKGYTAIVSKLLQHGADKSIRGWMFETPLEAAQRMNHAATVALLA